MKRTSKNKKSNVPAFIPNQPGTGLMGLTQGERNREEAFRNRQNRMKYALRKK